MKQLFSLIFSKLLAALPKVVESNEAFYRQQIIMLQRVLLSKGVKRILATRKKSGNCWQSASNSTIKSTQRC